MEENEIKNDKIQDALDKVEMVFENTADETAGYDAKDISDNKIFAVLAYFGILVLIPIFAAKNSKFARFHSNQGLILLIVSVIVSIIQKIPHLGWVGWILYFVWIAFAVVGIINACRGKAKELPFVGKYRILK